MPQTIHLAEIDQEIDQMIQNLEKLRNSVARLQNQDENGQRRPDSYVRLAVGLLTEIGHPSPITVLLERIRERRNDPTITRGSVETSLLRHLNSKGDKAEVVKPSPGTYALEDAA